MSPRRPYLPPDCWPPIVSLGHFPQTLMNADGLISGAFWDPNLVSQRFVRSASGTITTFNASNARSRKTQSTFPAAINAVSSIVGWFVKQNGVNHGFLRTLDGTTNDFDASGANDSIVGVFNDIILALHGFLRTPDGTITVWMPRRQQRTTRGNLGRCHQRGRHNRWICADRWPSRDAKLCPHFHEQVHRF